METVKLNNGVEMPILGYGVYQVTSALVTGLSIRHKLIIMKKGSAMPSRNAVCHVKNCSSRQKSGSRMPERKKQKRRSTNRYANCKAIMSTCCLSISLSTITTGLTGLWKKPIKKGKPAPSVSVTSMPIVL